jgi:hypothetical protein
LGSTPAPPWTAIAQPAIIIFLCFNLFALFLFEREGVCDEKLKEPCWCFYRQSLLVKSLFREMNKLCSDFWYNNNEWRFDLI